MTLKQIFERKLLSARAYNVCGMNDLYNLNLILAYFRDNASFIKLRNCGDGTNMELIEFCKRQSIELGDLLPVKLTTTYSTLVASFSRKQREVVNSFIQINFSKMSNRSQNAVRLHLQNNLKAKSFARKILDRNINVGEMKNVGRKSIPEIQKFIKVIKDFYSEISLVKDEHKITVLKNNYLLLNSFSLKNVPEQVANSKSIIQVANFLLEKNVFFDKKESVILKKSLNIYNNCEILNLDDIASEIKLTRERVRQIKVKCIIELPAKFDIIKNFDDDLYSNYGIEENMDFIFIDDELRSKINRFSQTHFSSNFITFLLYRYQLEFYDLIGNLEDVLQNNVSNHRNRYNWKAIYLVNRLISKEFDFNALLYETSMRLNERISETYTFNFKSYLSNFLLNEKIEVLDDVMIIAEKVLYEELNLIVDLYENISFERNTSKLAFEYAFEALEYLGKPSKVQDIVKAVRYHHPNYKTDESKIRASMKRKYGFVPVGRKSVFGLKKWEKELEGFKGGTIRTITKEYLEGFSLPLHKKDIAKHVKRYRPKTNANSIYNNLYIDESKTFKFFENYLIGLASKKYPKEYKLLSKASNPTKRTWEESLIALQQFIAENERLPNSINCSESEQKLYRWLNIQRRKLNRNELLDCQVEPIKIILSQFRNGFRQRSLSKADRFKALKKFVVENSRLPKAHIPDEQYLYAFHYKLRKKFEADSLNEIEKNNLIEVALILQNNTND